MFYKTHNRLRDGQNGFNSKSLAVFFRLDVRLVSGLVLPLHIVYSPT